MLLTSSNIYMKCRFNDPGAVVSSRILANQRGILGGERYAPNEMHRTVFFRAEDIPEESKSVFVQFFTLRMFIYNYEWRP